MRKLKVRLTFELNKVVENNQFLIDVDAVSIFQNEIIIQSQLDSVCQFGPLKVIDQFYLCNTMAIYDTKLCSNLVTLISSVQGSDRGLYV